VILVEPGPAAVASPLIVRRAGRAQEDGAAHDLILLPRGSASPEALSRSIHELLALRRLAGDYSPVDLRVRVVSERTASRRRLLPWAARAFAELQNAAPSDTRGLGSVRRLLLWLPPNVPAVDRPTG
jgi:hypothetical protein